MPIWTPRTHDLLIIRAGLTGGFLSVSLPAADISNCAETNAEKTTFGFF